MRVAAAAVAANLMMTLLLKCLLVQEQGLVFN